MSYEPIKKGSLKFLFDGGDYIQVQTGQQEPIIIDEIKPLNRFDLTFKFVAPLKPGHYVSKFRIHTNTLPSYPVNNFVVCDIRVEDENDVSVVLNDLMDLSNTSRMQDFDQRLLAIGVDTTKR